MSNEHFDYATAAFGSANANATTAFNEAVRADALIQATLALAYEQRTANLITIWRTGEIRVGDETFGIIAEKRFALFAEIAGRLGFEEQP